MPDKLTVGSLFSGIQTGGFDLGLERAGMEVIWQVENEPYCQKVLAKHWPDVPRYGDIKEIDWNDVERPDLICGGFPCQPVSLAGKRLAQADERWLWPEFFRAVRALRPRFVLVENVPGLLSAGLSDVLGDLADLGFDAEWSVLPACSLGAPHSRPRLYVLAYTQLSTGRETSWIHADGTSGDYTPRPCPRTRPRLGVRPGDIRAWADEVMPGPLIRRVAHGVPARVDRLRGLGNAVVPQVAQWVGERIMAYAAAM